jgi:hypothetical protein
MNAFGLKRSVVLSAILVASAAAIGCRPSTAERSPAAASTGQPRSDTPADAAAPAAAAGDPVCAEYQRILRSFGTSEPRSLRTPSGGTGVSMGPWEMPQAEGLLPPIEADSPESLHRIMVTATTWEIGERAYKAGAEEEVRAALAASPRWLVLAEPSLPASRVTALLPLAGQAELGLAVRRSGRSRVPEFVAYLPQTPAWVRDLLLVKPEPGFDPSLIIPAIGRGTCPAVPKSFELLDDGAGLDLFGPALADALATCDCRVADRDGFVAYMLAATVPWPNVGSAKLDAGAIASLRPAATVADLGPLLSPPPR